MRLIRKLGARRGFAQRGADTQAQPVERVDRIRRQVHVRPDPAERFGAFEYRHRVTLGLEGGSGGHASNPSARNRDSHLICSLK
jgi:hypothetical protein